MDKGTAMTWGRGSIYKFQFSNATRQRWVFKEERNCANAVEDLTEKGNEFQIAGPAYEKEVEPFFFDLILGTTSSGRRTNDEENWVARSA
jgi:hypothetical protein